MRLRSKILTVVMLLAAVAIGAHGSVLPEPLSPGTALPVQEQDAVSNSGAVKKPVLTAKFVPDSVMIGDQYYLEVQVEKDVMQVVEFPEFPSGKVATYMEILQETPPDTLSHDGRTVVLGKKYLLTCFDAGIYQTPPFPALYLDKNIVDTIWTAEPMRLFVNTFEIDTLTHTIHDVKVPIKAPVKFWEFGGYLIWGVMLLLVLVIIYMMLKKSSGRRTADKAMDPDLPPHVTAIGKLEELNSHKLWQSGKFKQYYTGVTDILREYIERRYGIPAMEMTSSEIIGAINESVGNPAAMDKLADVMLTADLVKFAKYTPDADKNEKVYFEAYYFVEETKELPAEIISGQEEGGGDEK